MRMWNLRIKVHPSGTIQVTGLSEDIPPGEFELRGCDDGNRVTLEARQRDTAGRFVIAANHHRDRAEEALEQAEELADAVTAAGGQAAVGVGVETIRETGQA